MEPNTNLIIELLQSDLRNSKLIYNLNNAGVLVEDFYTDLCKPIFQLMGFEEDEQDDALYDLYFNTLEDLCDNDLEEFLPRRNKLALELHATLLAEKKVREHLKKKELR
jgi:hypothetical protein